MENRINQLITLSSGEKYLILNQAIYQNKNYYLAAEVTEDKENVTGKFSILEEIIENGDAYLKLVTDPRLLDILLKYLPLQENQEV